VVGGDRIEGELVLEGVFRSIVNSRFGIVNTAFSPSPAERGATDWS
jgi:hypothetical protein